MAKTYCVKYRKTKAGALHSMLFASSSDAEALASVKAGALHKKLKLAGAYSVASLKAVVKRAAKKKKTPPRKNPAPQKPVKRAQKNV